ncbi:MAG: redox-sensing transcriptional repressor Rex, partial [Candidatus Muiribacteriaceae bacterium]
MPNQKNIYIPEPSLRRLPLYHQIVKKYLVSEKQYISCTFIARALNLIPIQVRKDLSFTGITGYPRKGYPLKELYEVLEDFLGWNTRNEAFLVGAGSLGTAMLGYDGFKRIGFEIV